MAIGTQNENSADYQAVFVLAKVLSKGRYATIVLITPCTYIQTQTHTLNCRLRHNHSSTRIYNPPSLNLLAATLEPVQETGGLPKDTKSNVYNTGK